MSRRAIEALRAEELHLILAHAVAHVAKRHVRHRFALTAPAAILFMAPCILLMARNLGMRASVYPPIIFGVSMLRFFWLFLGVRLYARRLE